MATDGQIVVAAARWSDEGHYLREFVAKNRLPAVVKVIKGQYGGLGVPTLPSPGLQSTALLVSAGRRRKIAAQAVKLKEGRRVVGVGPRLAIPESYPGYFELLSEEGRAVRCIESVAELARRRVDSGGVLVREPIRGLVARHGTDDASCTAEGARTVSAGETLCPAGEVQLGSGSKGRYLRCLDSRGDAVLLGLDQRGRFSALARDDNISGVHTVRNLLSKRLPLTVRLVHGTPPRGLKSHTHFVRELRLLHSFEEEHVFALPLHKDANTAIALPLAAPLKLQRTRNDDQLRGLPEFQRLVERCSRLVAEVADRIHVIDGKLEPKTRHAGLGRAGYFLRRSASTDSAPVANHADRENRSPPPSQPHPHRGSATLDEYDEIDQIYDYVRGFAPLPKTIRTPYSEAQPPQASPESSPATTPTSPDAKPIPPPIETIPGKQQKQAAASTQLSIRAAVKAEKRPRRGQPMPATQQQASKDAPGLPKLFLKSANGQHGASQRGRVLRQKSASPLKEQAPPLTTSKAGSPLFNIRYKSLSNLHPGMELDGTLDSSHSGGRTSGDSAAGPKLPEKRLRRLSRPRSLTNLVWELRGECPKLEPGVHRTKANAQPTKLTLTGTRRVGTLYL